MDLPKALGLESHGAEENTVSFELYAACQDAPAAELAALRVRLLNHVLPFLRGYIWQRDRFSLHLSAQQQAPWHRKRMAAMSRGHHSRAESAAAAPQQPPHLWGSVDFGDNVEDEWFIVWLLLELTQAFPVTARVWDNDGEFLLIEAAYGLPRWVKPETAQNRVWLHGGAFHLVPLPRFAGDPLLAATPSMAQALAAVRGTALDTHAPHKMQSALQQRLEGFPGRAAESMHVAHALVPARVAHLLRCEPQLLAAAVEAFHYRIPDDVKAASRMAVLPPSDMVLAAPTFSRCLYAQLALQEYAPPRGYPMPMPSDPLYGPAELGLKLTAGFEMMLANRARFGQQQEGAGDSTGTVGAGPGISSRATPPSKQEEGDEEARLAADAGWLAFKAHLGAGAYFQGSLPGSPQHTQLLQAAVEQYRQSEQYLVDTSALAAPAACADVLLQQAVDPASFPPASQLPPQGSEGWMQEQAGQQLEAELAQRQREMEQSTAQRQRRQPAGEGGGAAAAAASGGPGEEFDPTQLAGQLRAFVEKMSGLEGAEVPMAAEGGPAGSGIALDEAAFAAELQKVLGLTQAAMRHAGLSGGDGGGGHSGAGDESGSESSEEGSSFFSGSEGDSDASSPSDETDEQQQQPGLYRRQHQAAQSPAAAAAAAALVQSDSGGPAASPVPDSAAAQAEEGEQEEQQGWEADTATDSDDDARFMQAYAAAMNQQLAATRMADSFELAPAAASDAAGAGAGGSGGHMGRSAAAGGHAADAQRQEEGGEEDGEQEAAAAALRPVDLDVNLVKSLLASYGEQQGLPGPAGTLAGLMGVRLPHPRSQQ